MLAVLSFNFCFFVGHHLAEKTSVAYGQSFHGFPHSTNCCSAIIAFEGRKCYYIQLPPCELPIIC
jgi:hypothetical protein